MSKLEADRRPKTGGRKKGTPNKTTTIAKEAIAEAFERMGGTAALVAWADQNDDHRKVFYGTIYPKLLPLQVNAELAGKMVHEVTHKIIDGNAGN